MTTPASLIQTFRLDADTRRRYTRHLTKALLWGPAAKSALVEGGALDESQVAIIGCPRLDFFHPEAFRNGPNPASSPSGAGFVGGFPPINQFDHRSVFATIDGLRVAQARGSVYDADGNLEDLFWWYYAGARLFMDLLDEWILRRGGVAYYRPHPFEHFGSYNYLKKKYGKEFVLDGPLNPFPLWLASVSALVINRNSSTILPALFSPFYHRLHIVQLRATQRLVGDPELGNHADRWERYLDHRWYSRRALAYKAVFKLLYY